MSLLWSMFIYSTRIVNSQNLSIFDSILMICIKHHQLSNLVLAKNKNCFGFLNPLDPRCLAFPSTRATQSTRPVLPLSGPTKITTSSRTKGGSKAGGSWPKMIKGPLNDVHATWKICKGFKRIYNEKKSKDTKGLVFQGGTDTSSYVLGLRSTVYCI